MVDIKDIQKQLAAVGFKTPIWQKAEVNELCNALTPEEHIVQAVNGYYEGGLGLLVATNHRLLLVDRKPMFLTLDAINYGMIQEVSLNYRLLNSTIHIWTSNKCLDFSTWSHERIREVLDYAQKSVQASRDYHHDQNDELPPANVPEPREVLQQEPVVPIIDYKGAFTTAKTPEQMIIQQPTVGSMPIAPADLTVTKKKIDKVTQLTGRVFARHYY